MMNRIQWAYIISILLISLIIIIFNTVCNNIIETHWRHLSKNNYFQSAFFETWLPFIDFNIRYIYIYLMSNVVEIKSSNMSMIQTLSLYQVVNTNI